MYHHAPVAFNLARLPRHQVSPDRPRHRAHSIFVNGDHYVRPLIPNPVNGADNCGRALIKLT